MSSGIVKESGLYHGAVVPDASEAADGSTSSAGYIHVKAIPGADPLLIEQTGFLADRMSVNLELPTAGARGHWPRPSPREDSDAHAADPEWTARMENGCYGRESGGRRRTRAAVVDCSR